MLRRITMELLIAIGVWCLVFGGLGGWIADQKSRDAGEGACLGFVFGPLGVLIEGLLPQGQPKPMQLATEEQRVEWARVERDAAIAQQAREEAKAVELD